MANRQSTGASSPPRSVNPAPLSCRAQPCEVEAPPAWACVRLSPETGQLSFRFPGLGWVAQATDTVKAVARAFDLPEGLWPRQWPEWRPRLAAANAMLGLFAQLELPVAVCLGLANDADLRLALLGAPTHAFEPAWMQSPGHEAGPLLAAVVSALLRHGDAASACRVMNALSPAVADATLGQLSAHHAVAFNALVQMLEDQGAQAREPVMPMKPNAPGLVPAPKHAVAAVGLEPPRASTVPGFRLPGTEVETPVDLKAWAVLRRGLKARGLAIKIDPTGELSVQLRAAFLRDPPVDDLLAFFHLITGDASQMHLARRLIGALRSALDALQAPQREQALKRLGPLFGALVTRMPSRLAWTMERRDLISAVALLECLLDMEALGVVAAQDAIDALLKDLPPVAEVPLPLQDWVTGEEAVTRWLKDESCPLDDKRKGALRQCLDELMRQVVERCGDWQLAALVRFAKETGHEALDQACFARMVQQGAAAVLLQPFEQDHVLQPGSGEAFATLCNNVRTHQAALRLVDEFIVVTASSRFETRTDSRKALNALMDTISTASRAIETPAEALAWIGSVQSLLRSQYLAGSTLSGDWGLDCELLLGFLNAMVLRLLTAEPYPPTVEAQHIAAWLMVSHTARTLLEQKEAREAGGRLSASGPAADHAACWAAWHAQGGVLAQTVELLCEPGLWQGGSASVADMQALSMRLLKEGSKTVALALLRVAPLAWLPQLLAPAHLPGLVVRLADEDGLGSLLWRWSRDPGMDWLPEPALALMSQAFTAEAPPQWQPALLHWHLVVLLSANPAKRAAWVEAAKALNTYRKYFDAEPEEWRFIGSGLCLGPRVADVQWQLDFLVDGLGSGSRGVWLAAGWLEHQFERASSGATPVETAHGPLRQFVMRWLKDNHRLVAFGEWKKWIVNAKDLQDLGLR